jgi:anti-sigma factor RsiW
MGSQPLTPAEHEALEASLSDFLDGGLPAEQARAVEQHLTDCAGCKEALRELGETRHALSGLHRTPAPPDFEREVAETIRRRSQGRFFGRRTFGDRVPLEILALLALALGLVLYFFLRSSETGSLGPLDREPSRPAIEDSVPELSP